MSPAERYLERDRIVYLKMQSVRDSVENHAHLHTYEDWKWDLNNRYGKRTLSGTLLSIDFDFVQKALVKIKLGLSRTIVR